MKFWHIFVLAGFILVHLYLMGSHQLENSQIAVSFCPLKKITGFPCPSCGSTRAILQLYQGDFAKAIQINPLGIVTLVVGWTLFILALLDIWMKRNWLEKVITQLEDWLSKKIVWIPALILLVMNWIWNIFKGI